MSTTTVVHLLRHGEVYNPQQVLYGRLPGYHLSDRGRAMAELAAKWLADRDTVTAVYSSPLERAQETAQPVADAAGVTPRLDERLIEAENSFEGESVTVAEMLVNPRMWGRVYNPLRPSWGEPYVHIRDRMVDMIKAVRRETWGGVAVCVSHQLPIWTVRRAAEGRPLWHRPDRRQCSLASVTTLTFEDQRLLSVGYSEPAAQLYT
ncbi:histidine phosphatase family protein [Lipingzhangella sp. LS1_29]|uniref:Histidine phosphatase family protein n=1 Tax=Lipingzhangella rawalii TaxID=2055835 RepID=A0ABU2HA65_9ACTN|nr:histidine phosphatase family protein [Lipingzhangella rawalii]MDS1271907.1 histidine phosphatase family protein [Lipingzhangella rawalii]